MSIAVKEVYQGDGSKLETPREGSTNEVVPIVVEKVSETEYKIKTKNEAGDVVVVANADGGDPTLDEVVSNGNTSTKPILVDDTAGGFPIDDSAVLERRSETKGDLGVRLTTTQRDAIVNPAEGLEIYNLTSKKKEVFDGVNWVSLGGDTKPYKEVILLMSQSGTANPTIDEVVLNEVGGTFTATRTGVGVYVISNTGFNANSKTVLTAQRGLSAEISYQWDIQTNNTVTIKTHNQSNVLTDGILELNAISMKVF